MNSMVEKARMIAAERIVTRVRPYYIREFTTWSIPKTHKKLQCVSWPSHRPLSAKSVSIHLREDATVGDTLPKASMPLRAPNSPFAIMTNTDTGWRPRNKKRGRRIWIQDEIEACVKQDSSLVIIDVSLACHHPCTGRFLVPDGPQFTQGMGEIAVLSLNISSSVAVA